VRWRDPLAVWSTPMTTTTIRLATDQDWPNIYPFYAAIMAEGKTYAFPEGQTLDEARPWWMEQSPGRAVCARLGALGRVHEYPVQRGSRG